MDTVDTNIQDKTMSGRMGVMRREVGGGEKRWVDEKNEEDGGEGEGGEKGRMEEKENRK